MNFEASPAFTGLLLDRADHLRLAPDRISELVGHAEARLLRLAGINPDLDPDGGLTWSPISGQPDEGALIFLGLANERPLFAPLIEVTPDMGLPMTILAMVGSMIPEEVSLWGMVRSLLVWHSRHGYCANCGTATRPFRAGWGRKCSGCETEHFPKIDPVVIMLAQHDGRVLVGRSARFPARSYSALAGFMEPGESIEEAVARELKEEAGIDVTNVSYVASQPWPFPGSLMIGCFAEAKSDELTLDPTELEDAIWADRNAVEAALAGSNDGPFVAPPDWAIANTLLRRWLKS